MKYTCVVISVADINAAREFYEDLFGLEVYQNYGRNIAFTCGLALQQDFDGFLNKLKEFRTLNIWEKSLSIVGGSGSFGSTIQMDIL